MKRREFLDKFAVGVVAGAGIITTAATIGEILPPPTESYQLVKLGELNNFPLNDFTFIPGKKIYIYRTRQYVRAISGVCTHLGCTINKAEKGFKCPCHGSQFSDQGVPFSGPAARPLDKYRIIVDKQGHLIVDLGQRAEADFIIG